MASDSPAATRVLALSNVSRALGLAEAIQTPTAPLIENSVRAVASEIAVLLTATRDYLRAEAKL